MDSKIEPVAWMWEIVVDPTGETVIGKTATQFATHRSTGPDDAKPLYTEAALLAAEQRGRESERGEIVKALSKFVPDYEPWMDKHADGTPLTIHRTGNTFGDLRAAHAAIRKGDET